MIEVTHVSEYRVRKTEVIIERFGAGRVAGKKMERNGRKGRRKTRSVTLGRGRSDQVY